MKLQHITKGQLGVHADNSEALTQAVTTLTDAGYSVTDVEDDPEESWHVATVHYDDTKGIQQEVGKIRRLLA